MSALATTPIVTDRPGRLSARAGPQLATAERAPGAAVATPDRVLVIGEKARVERIRRALKERGPDPGGIVTAVSVVEAARWLREQLFEVVVLVAPLRGATLERALSYLRALPRGRRAPRRGGHPPSLPQGVPRLAVHGHGDGL